MWLDAAAATVMRFTACSRFHESHEPIASITMTAAAINAMTDFSSALTERRLSMERIHFEGRKDGPALRARRSHVHQAARTVRTNFSTSDFRRPLSLARNCAEASTCADAVPVSLAPRLTSL